MFQMYYCDHYGQSNLGLCSTEEVGAQRIGGKTSRLVFVEDCEQYDYFTVHLQVDGFGNDDAILYSARTIQECEEYIQLRQYDGETLGILGQKFGQDVQSLWA